MILQQLQVHSLRSFNTAKLTFNNKCNYILGENATGKTTILEAIYLLSSGHSFKTREISPLIQHGQGQLVIHGNDGYSHLMIAKSLNMPTIVKIDEQPCLSTSQLAYLMPCQIYYQDIFQIMDAGPTIRRAMLDWGMFHVKHDYLQYWKRYKQILKQRNSLLKQKPKKELLNPWDDQLAQVGERISSMRSDYIKLLKIEYTTVLKQLSNLTIQLNYDKGWDKKDSGLSLRESLANNIERDIHRGYTSVGIHQADILLETDETQAKKILSRGQQKIALIGLKLSQSQLLNKQCIHLMDDIFAELDAQHQKQLANYIKNSDDQFFLTVLAHDKQKLDVFPEGKMIELPLEKSKNGNQIVTL
ncbi:DNA replication/repair protein RecF [Legionella sp. W05-934-2]|jgi:DNA replication and repair protein RecF|uniref:DNA replication/repair protein RecF n=1 Tax=Legionella sp. W05-934-2 TaxID=1198649 RepID=UPI0034630D3D